MNHNQRNFIDLKKIFSVLLVAIVMGCAGKGKKNESPMAADGEKAVKSKADKMVEKAKGTSSAANVNTCSIKSDSRTIEVKGDGSGGCEVFYTKFGQTKSVAAGKKGDAYCEKVATRIVGNLTKAGFSCN